MGNKPMSSLVGNTAQTVRRHFLMCWKEHLYSVELNRSTSDDSLVKL